ncbi:MAG: DUF11 domain-containing protein [Myxococcales bacterium]|nr:DUF11 domain-containing protein [Myxococcales bacterium]
MKSHAAPRSRALPLARPLLPLGRLALLPLAALTVAVALPRPALADELPTLLQSWEGGYDFFATGAPLAVDGPDNDEAVDTLNMSAVASVSADDLVPGAEIVAAYLYWGGSIQNNDCGGGGLVDDEVSFAAPGGSAELVAADKCFCSDAGAMAYDMQLCRAEVTDMIDELVGDYTVGEFAALIENGDTHTASFSIVLVYAHEFLKPRRVSLYEGLQTLWLNGTKQIEITLDGLDVDSPPEGDLTWYVLEGDINGSMMERVEVAGAPGGGVLTLSDPINPEANPMNHTINTTTPPQTDAIGVDIDQFDLAGALTQGDNAVKVTYTADLDKFWIAYNIVGVNVYQAVLLTNSSKTWALQDDADQSGDPTPGDTIRYTIHLENTGTAPASATLNDVIPPEAAEWTLVDDGGATDGSTQGELILSELALAPTESVDIVLDVVIADVPEGTEINNTAIFDASPDGDQGELVAPPVVIGGAAATTTGDAATDTDATSTTDDSGTSTGDSGTGGDPSAGPTTGGSTGGTTSEDTTSGGTDSAADSFGDTEESESGCGCKSAPGGAPGGALALLALLAVGRRRRA